MNALFKFGFLLLAIAPLLGITPALVDVLQPSPILTPESGSGFALAKGDNPDMDGREGVPINSVGSGTR